MKVPDSGMPDEAYWESLFDVALILDRLGNDGTVRDVAELGCGYGTFTLPIARRVSGAVFAFDIESAMLARTRERADAASLTNVQPALRDVVADGFGLPDGSTDACLLFNILHSGEPGRLVAEAVRVVAPGGRILMIHWRSDIPTPRGPDLAIRPRYHQMTAWARAAGVSAGPAIDLPPWHLGVILTKPKTATAAQGSVAAS